MRKGILHMRHTLPLVLTLSLALRLFGDEVLTPPAQVASTERVAFAPGGTIRVDSYGDLYVEGWDEPQVELTVLKVLPYGHEAAHPERPAQQLEAVRVVAERASPSELAISIKLPARFGWVWHPTSPVDPSHVRLEYQIHVPRNSKLAIHQGVGLVSVRNVTGDIEASCHRGDIVLWLAGTGTYSIDARSRLGKVSSDFPGPSLSRFLVGQKFASINPAASQRLYLRAGFGGITIKPILPESEPPVASER
jgi:hypothetical protein